MFLLFKRGTPRGWNPAQTVYNRTCRPLFLQSITWSPLVFCSEGSLGSCWPLLFAVGGSLLNSLALGNEFLPPLSVCKDFYFICLLYAAVAGEPFPLSPANAFQ